MSKLTMFEKIKEEITESITDIDKDYAQQLIEDMCGDDEEEFNEDKFNEIWDRLINVAVDAINKVTE